MSTTLSPLSPLSRLAALRRIPFWAQALALCALFAIAGVAVLDDYGMTWDEPWQRRTAVAVADYALGASEEPPGDYMHDRYYGVAFEMPLLLIERALRLQDTRRIYLTRHLIAHLFFIAGGFACGMLAYRMLGSRWLALFAMLLFLLHPRLYAHSFFNTKDIPFLVMFAVALYLARRAFRKDTLGAFLLCGISVGLAINLRPFALMLPPMILAMRALDLRQPDKAERKRILASAGIFAAATLATMYISHPYYWENPLRFFEGIRVLSQHPNILPNLFMGKLHLSDALPWNFIPVWFAITAPPLTLLLGAIGCAAVCWQSVSRPLAALLDRETRFRILLLGCFVMPVIVVIVLQFTLYNDWRHMYFLWAPFCLLAAVGLRAITNIRMGGGIWKVGARLPGWVRSGDRLHIARRTLACAVAGVGLATTATAMAALHPHQHVYFNPLVDTKTPGALAKRYDMDYPRMAQRQLLEYLLARYPGDALRVWPGTRHELTLSQILPQRDRERILSPRNLNSADYHIPLINRGNALPNEPEIHAVKAYGSSIAYLFAPKNSASYRAAYHDVAANGTPLTRSDFDIYIHNGDLYYLNADCEPLTANGIDPRVVLRIFPADPSDLPASRREHGFEVRRFLLNNRASFFDGKCIIRQALPDYPVARVRTELRAQGEPIWRADADLPPPLHERIAAGDYGKPVAQSDFDVYLRDGVLAYLKEPCAPGDTDAQFFLHIFPADPADLPTDSREHGFENMDFQFADHGARIGDKCAASRQLPAYPIDRIRAGQFVSGGGAIWQVEFAAAR